MKYFIYKDLSDSLIKLYQGGGTFQKKAEKAYAVLGKVKAQLEDPFKGLPLTNHGETRIKHCWKYDLGDGVRLITICDNDIHSICYVGKHSDCDVWIEKNRGLELTVDRDQLLTSVPRSQSIKDPNRRLSTDSDLSDKPLRSRISERHLNKISEHVPWSILNKFSSLTSMASDEEILELALEITDKNKQDVFYDVFSLLKAGKTDEAVKRIELFFGSLVALEEVEKDVAPIIEAGDDFIDFEDFEPEIIEHFMKTATFQKWMLFMHPEQRKIVEKTFNGPAKLIGVSGSGKTCIIVKRAIYLAELYREQKILILTLNKSLAGLIQNLIHYACYDKTVRDQIEVCSFWGFCQRKLKEFEPENQKLYDELTWKTGEHIDEVWNEYFECKLNNDEAKVLDPVNKTLLVRKILPKDYLRQEFDWIRSALPIDRRDEYVRIEREGRTEQLSEEFKKLILLGLNGWEDKMQFVGVVDYLGLSEALYRHIDKIKPEYRCILVDEMQDFGTIELDIIRRLVSKQENDLFLCGDIAQQVYTKHHKLKLAGIEVTGRSFTIKKNYRNSREILEAAYDVLSKNVDLEKLKSEDFEILEPEYANFSSPKPLLVKASSLNEEFGACYNFVKQTLESHQKACIALCGYSLYDIVQIGKHLELPVLDGNTSIDNHNIFLSDLEQTKGFEFDIVVIVNCNQSVIPNRSLPEGEWYRDISRFYVAMTRAKLSLMISYSRNLSAFLKKCEDKFKSWEWKDHVKNTSIPNYFIPTPMQIKNESKYEYLELTGSQFLYTRKAIGISKELMDKLTELITGTNKTSRGVDGATRQVSWKTIGDALQALKGPDRPYAAQKFGLKTHREFEDLFEKREQQAVKFNPIVQQAKCPLCAEMVSASGMKSHLMNKHTHQWETAWAEYNQKHELGGIVSRRCRCGKPAIPGTDVCYTCGGE